MALTPDDIQLAIEHMNADHADAVLAYAQGLAGLAWAESATLTAIDTERIELLAIAPQRQQVATIPFSTPVSNLASLQQASVELAKHARQALS
jgi:putative heme iron utilization protein